MRRFSRDIADLASSYDAIVVGSGYGGGTAASRLSRMGLTVCVLERGREHSAFPDTLPELTSEFRTSGTDAHSGRQDALFDLRVGKDVHVLQGSGLGGTSLINAGVSLAPDPRIWEDPVWPEQIRSDGVLDEGFARARRMLRPQTVPPNHKPEKLDRLAEAAASVGARMDRVPVNIAMSSGINAAGVQQNACTHCGDCVTGCNVGAKTTVDITYIADAVNFGAVVFTEINVDSICRDPGGAWQVHYKRTSSHPFKLPTAKLSCRIVVLAAGSLGSTEILLRSKAKGLSVSDQLGKRFTGNQGTLAVAYNGDKSVNSVGVGAPPRAAVPPPGPTVAGAIDFREAGQLDDGVLIQELTIPGALGSLLPTLFLSGARVYGSGARVYGWNSNDDPKPAEHMPIADGAAQQREVESRLQGAYSGAVRNTQAYSVLGHDASMGQVILERDGGVGIEWPNRASNRAAVRADQAVQQIATALGATYLRNPLGQTGLGGAALVVHPLGGCSMGASQETGVVDHRCRVFDPNGTSPDDVHEGLYVTCGAIVPRSVGVGPLLTISALAERAMIHLAKDLGRALTDEPRRDAPMRAAANSIDHRISELSTPEMLSHMRGAGGSRRVSEAGDAATVARSAVTDVVDCSVFAPPVVPRRQEFLVQVFLHRPEQADRVEFLSRSMDDASRIRGRQTLQAEIQRGARIEISIEGKGLRVEQPFLHISWQGEPNVATFSALFPRDTELKQVHPVVRMSANGLPLGRIVFKIECVDNGKLNADVGRAQLIEQTARNYSSVFLSYSSRDRFRVSRCAQVLRATKFLPFLDVLSLQPGDRFHDKILERIDSADLFVLFWSRHAMKSEWVAKEIECAKRRQRENAEGLPDIAPIMLDRLARAPLPPDIADLHMNDIMAYLTDAERPSLWKRLYNALLDR